MNTYRDAKKHVDSLIFTYAEKIIPGYKFKIYYRNLSAQAMRVRVKQLSKNNLLLELIVDKAFIKANRHNIRSTAVRDTVIHELCHIKTAILGKVKHNHSTPEFRDCVKQHTGSVLHSLKKIPPGTTSHINYYGSKSGISPDWVNQSYVAICANCGWIVMVRGNYDPPACANCEGIIYGARNLTPSGTMRAMFLLEKYKDDEEALYERFERFVHGGRLR